MEIKKNNIERDEACAELLESYRNVFSHFITLKTAGKETFEMSNTGFADLIRTSAGLLLSSDDDLRRSIEDIVAVADNAMSPSAMAVGLQLLGGGETPIKQLRELAYAAMERENPDAAKEYIKSIL